MNAQITAQVWENYGSRGWRSAEAMADHGNIILREDVVCVLDRTPAGAATVETVAGQILNLSSSVVLALKI